MTDEKLLEEIRLLVRQYDNGQITLEEFKRKVTVNCLQLETT